MVRSRPPSATPRAAASTSLTPAPTTPAQPSPDGSSPDGEDADHADLQIPLGEAAVPGLLLARIPAGRLPNPVCL